MLPPSGDTEHVNKTAIRGTHFGRYSHRTVAAALHDGLPAALWIRGLVSNGDERTSGGFSAEQSAAVVLCSCEV